MPPKRKRTPTNPVKDKRPRAQKKRKAVKRGNVVTSTEVHEEIVEVEEPASTCTFTVTVPPENLTRTASVTLPSEGNMNVTPATNLVACTAVNATQGNVNLNNQTQCIPVESNSLWGPTLPTTSVVSGLDNIGMTNNTIPNLTTSPEDDIEVHVPMPLRQKIWKNEYINLSLMLKGSVELSEYCFGGPIYTDKFTGQLITKPQKNNEKITNVDQYTDAFLIYMSIYLQQYPSHASQMLKYLKTIRSAARTSHGWITYDEQFRLRRAINPSMLWGDINTTLWLTTVGMQSDPIRSNNAKI